MDKRFIKKQMDHVIKTYTEQSFSLPLTKDEENQLLQKIVDQVQQQGFENLQDILHDIIYPFFTNQDE
ncbi:YqzH family protein [Halalkalibacter alkaliphilus]|uniref:YqzH-like protein n=1 Tax=Halalkalibacter alkaliphilus TaxID=2917993 RepID=A0A9X2I6A7_9BACI|nr:YqzH family protein [Halalkalibacter alkaliphilus]MCL7747115.1 hypothetical protein [Halalkalibacter alkaliphilus]